jgi:hypothetical protein
MLAKMKKAFVILFSLVSFFCYGQKESFYRIGNKGAVKPLSVQYERHPMHHGTSEAGTIMKVRKGRVRILGARFIVNKMSFTDTGAFALNLYEVKDGRPTANVLYGPIKVGVVKTGLNDIDLGHYNISSFEDFFLALSWTGVPGGSKIDFGSGMHGNRSFHRADTSGEWERVPLMKLAFSVVVKKE